MNDLIPKDMSPDDFMDHLHDITGVAPAGNKNWQPSDTSERMRKAKHFSSAIQAYIDRPRKAYQEKIQSFITTADLPEPVTNTWDQFTDIVNFDQQWLSAVKDVSNRLESGRDFWEVVTLGEGSSWQLLPEGKSVKIQNRSGALTQINLIKTGDGIAWTDKILSLHPAKVA